MKQLIQQWIRQRNPAFRLHEKVSTPMLLSFCLQQCMALVRGCFVLFYGKNPKWMLCGKRVSMYYINKIKWGRLVKIGNDVQFSAMGTEGIRLGNHVSIGAFSRVIVATTLNEPGQFIRIGNNVGIGEFAYLGGAGGLEIGDDCIAGQYLSCHPENHLYSDTDTPIRLQGVSRKGIRIGRNCWLGSKVTLLDGVILGDGCVVAAGAVVTKSFPANSVIAGVPAKAIASRNLALVNEQKQSA